MCIRDRFWKISSNKYKNEKWKMFQLRRRYINLKTNKLHKHSVWQYYNTVQIQQFMPHSIHSISKTTIHQQNIQEHRMQEYWISRMAWICLMQHTAQSAIVLLLIYYYYGKSSCSNQIIQSVHTDLTWRHQCLCILGLYRRYRNAVLLFRPPGPASAGQVGLYILLLGFIYLFRPPGPAVVLSLLGRPT